MNLAENSPQNARNCTIFKNFRGMYIQNPKNFKVGPPPWEILHTPLYTVSIQYLYSIYTVSIQSQDCKIVRILFGKQYPGD